MLDRQKVVNFVSAKLKEQGCKSYDTNEGNRCKYRQGTLKCAIGHIIIDEEYSEEFESHSVKIIWNKIPKSLEPFMNDGSSYFDKKFLLLLQKCHDEATKHNFYQSFLINLRAYLDMQPDTVDA
jgi:hypothetical protein